MGFEYSEMVELKQKTVKLSKRVHQIHMKTANRIALLAIRKVKKMTPVDSGDLRQNWKHSVIKKGDSFIIVVYNQLEYASYVELGHRIVVEGVTLGWMEGRFMLKLTMDEMERIAPLMWTEKIEREMRDLFD